MPKRVAIILLLMSVMIKPFAQSIVSGNITDSLGKPLSFVAVTLKHDGKRFASTATNELGKFSFSLQKDTAAHFSIQFSLVGYSTLTK